MTQHYKEQEILKKIIDGNHEAFGFIYNKYRPILLKFAKRKLFTHQEAEDVIQEIFLSFWQRRNLISENIPLRNYFLGAINLKYAQHCRHNSVKKKYLNHYTNSKINSLSSNNLENKELRLQIRLASKMISAPSCRKIFELAYIQEHSCQEIAVLMNIKPQVVRNQTSKALKFIRVHLKKVI